MAHFFARSLEASKKREKSMLFTRLVTRSLLGTAHYTDNNIELQYTEDKMRLYDIT